MQEDRSPGAEYERRRADRRRDVERLRAVDDRIGSVGLWAASATAAVLAVSAFGPLPAAWALLPAAVVLMARIVHLRYATAAEVLESGVRHYDRGLARLEDRWAGQGREGREFEDPKHPYAGDFDLFGRGSLFELLCTVRTRAGEKSLATWLLAPGAPAAIRERQASVRELRDRLDLREDLARLGDDAAAGIRPDDLAAWGASAPELTAGVRRGAQLLTAASVATLVLFVLGVSAYPFAAAVLAILMFNWRTSGRIGRVALLGERAERELDLLAKVLRRLGAEPFATPRLKALQDSLRDAAVHVEALARLVQRLQAVRNELIRALAGLILWKAHCAFALEDWRARWGKGIA